MKDKDKNFEKNISRLVKLAGDLDKPSKEFVDSLTEKALGELQKGGYDRKRDRKDIIMKVSWKKILAYAASIVLVCGLTATFFMPGLTRSRQYAMHKTSNQKVENERVTNRRAKIEYTVAKNKRLDASKKLVKEPASKTEGRVVAMQTKSSESKVAAKGNKIGMAEQLSEAVAADKITSMNWDAEKSRRERGDVLAFSEDKSGIHAKIPVKCATKPMFVGTPMFMPGKPCPGRYPMAHGGTVPPNGEDVDAMFFKNYGVNPFVDTEDDHLSTFATDVDTGSYTVARGFLHDGHLPPAEAVRVEEFVNYFKYGYDAPQEDDFAVYTEAAPWRFGEGRKNSFLLRIGLKGKQVSEENRKPAILTFVIDVSGSMNRENRLGLVKKCLRMLVERLKPEDKIGIAVYGSRGRKVMGHRGLDERDEILAAIELLHAEGSTYAEQGIRIGYEMAEKNYKKGYINRVILCSDGVANVGKTGADGILGVIKEKADKGITLSAIGFGMGNYNDVLLERLGDKGNGHYVYIDTIAEAKKLFGDNLTGTLQVIARDVKVQVDFNPKVVRSYRLIGYENRDVPDDKFRDDKYDGGEVGAGHSVTALYELKLWPDKKGTAATTYVRYKDADTYAVTEFKSSITTGEFNRDFESSSNGYKLAATVGEFAEILRKSYWARGAKLGTVLKNAQQLNKELEGDTDVIELVDLISKASQLMNDVDTKVEAGAENRDECIEP